MRHLKHQGVKICTIVPLKAVLISVKDGSFKRFENGAVKLLAKETKWTSLDVTKHPIFLETLISKYVFAPVELLGLSRNRELFAQNASFLTFWRFSGWILAKLAPI